MFLFENNYVDTYKITKNDTNRRKTYLKDLASICVSGGNNIFGM